MVPSTDESPLQISWTVSQILARSFGVYFLVYSNYQIRLISLTIALFDTLYSLAASTPRGGATDNLTDALGGSDAAPCAEKRAIKVEIENVEVPCLLLSPGFYYTTNAHYLCTATLTWRCQ